MHFGELDTLESLTLFGELDTLESLTLWIPLFFLIVRTWGLQGDLGGSVSRF